MNLPYIWHRFDSYDIPFNVWILLFMLIYISIVIRKYLWGRSSLCYIDSLETQTARLESSVKKNQYNLMHQWWMFSFYFITNFITRLHVLFLSQSWAIIQFSIVFSMNLLLESLKNFFFLTIFSNYLLASAYTVLFSKVKICFLLTPAWTISSFPL